MDKIVECKKRLKYYNQLWSKCRNSINNKIIRIKKVIRKKKIKNLMKRKIKKIKVRLDNKKVILRINRKDLFKQKKIFKNFIV